MKKQVALVLGMLLSTAGIAGAGSSTSNMTVTATVTSSCTISAGPLAFGNYDAVAGPQVDATAQLSVACSRGAITSITLGQGQNPGVGSTDAVPLRRMKRDTATEMLSYMLYQDALRVLPWGNTALTGHVYIPATSAATNVPVYGRINALQDVPTGSYTDVVVATITF